MLTTLICDIIKDINEKLYYDIEEVDFYFSDSKRRKVISFTFSKDQDYNEFLQLTKDLWTDLDVSFQDDRQITIDYSENIVDNILKLTKQFLFAEIDRVNRDIKF